MGLPARGRSASPVPAEPSLEAAADLLVQAWQVPGGRPAAAKEQQPRPSIKGQAAARLSLSARDAAPARQASESPGPGQLRRSLAQPEAPAPGARPRRSLSQSASAGQLPPGAAGQSPQARSRSLSARPSQAPRKSLAPAAEPAPRPADEFWVDLDFSARDLRAATLAERLAKVQSHGLVGFSRDSGRAVIMREMKFKPRHYGAWMSDAPTAEFSEVAVVKAIAADLVELYRCYPGSAQLVFWRREQVAAAQLRAEHEQWLATLAQNKAEKIRQLVVAAGIPQAQLQLRVVTMKPDPSGDGGGKCGVYLEFDRTAEQTRLNLAESTRMERAHALLDGPAKGIIDFDFATWRIRVLRELLWKPRRFFAHSMDMPTAEQRDQGAMNEVLRPLAEFIKVMEAPAAISMTVKEVPKDDPNLLLKDWMRALTWNRAEYVRRHLVLMGVPAELLTVKTASADGQVCEPPSQKYVESMNVRGAGVDPRRFTYQPQSGSHAALAAIAAAAQGSSSSSGPVPTGFGASRRASSLGQRELRGGGSPPTSPLLLARGRPPSPPGSPEPPPARAWSQGPVQAFAGIGSPPLSPTAGSPGPGARSPAPGLRSPVPGLRSPAPGPRSPALGLRSPVPGPRSPAPVSRSPAMAPGSGVRSAGAGDSPPDALGGTWQEALRSRQLRPTSSGASARRLVRPGDGPLFEPQERPAEECALLVDLEGASALDLPASPLTSPAPPKVGSSQKLLNKFQAKKELEKLVHISRVDEIPLLLEAVESARRAGFEESRVDPLYSQAEDTIQRLRKADQRRRAWVRHGDREAAMRFIKPVGELR